MNCTFTPPLPDEFLLGAAARWDQAFLGRQTRALSLALIGRPYPAISIFLPHGLDVIAQNLPGELGLTTEDLIFKHTLFPYIAPFAAADDRNNVRNLMLGPKLRRSAIDRWLQASRLNSQTYLKYCPCCLRGQFSQYGFGYWRRVHQIPILDICPDHLCLLITSFVKAMRTDIAAHPRYFEECRTSIVSSQDKLQHLIAEDIKYIFDSDIRAPGRDKMREAAQQLVGQALGWTPTSGGWRKVEEQIHLRLPESPSRERILGHFSAPTVFSIADRAAAGHVYSILARAFGKSLRNLMVDAESCSCERGPWPCMNPSCTSYKQTPISKCIRYNQFNSLAFRCPDCGISYRRPLPLRRATDGTFAFTFAQVDGVWSNGLRQCWSDVSQTWASLSHRFQKCPGTIARAACDLGLPDMAGRSLRCYRVKRKNLRRVVFNSRRAAKRVFWLATPSIHSSAPLANLPATIRRVRDWLMRNDYTWYTANTRLRFNHKLKIQRSVRARRAARDRREQKLALLLDKLEPSMRKRRNAQRGRVSYRQLVQLLADHSNVALTSIDRCALIRGKLMDMVESKEDHFYRLLRLAYSNPSYATRGFCFFVVRAGIREYIKNKKSYETRARNSFFAMKNQLACAA